MARTPFRTAPERTTGPAVWRDPSCFTREGATAAGYGVVYSPLDCRASWREKLSTTVMSAPNTTVKAM